MRLSLPWSRWGFLSLYFESSFRGAQAKTLKVSSSEMEELKQKFKDLQGSNLEKWKELHSEIFSKVNWGRLVIFLNFIGSARTNGAGMGTII